MISTTQQQCKEASVMANDGTAMTSSMLHGKGKSLVLVAMSSAIELMTQ